MTLLDIEKSCKAEASIIKVDGKGYEELTKNELANLYCDYDEQYNFSEDSEVKSKADIMRSALWSALLLRYWFKIYNWYRESRSLGLELIDFFDWLADSLRDAFYYRSWRKLRWDVKLGWIDNPQYVEDENAADKSINYFCGAKRGKEYQAANKHKRKSNYGGKLSIDKTFDEDGYSILDKEGLSVNGSTYNGLRELVNLFLSQDKTIEAIIVDSIAYGDSVKEDKQKYTFTREEIEDETPVQVEEEVTRYNFMFDARKLVKYLNSIDENYFTTYFMKNYKVEDYKPILEKLKSFNNAKLYREIEKTITMIKTNKELLAYIL